MQWDLKNTGKSGRTGNRAPVFWKNHCVKIGVKENTFKASLLNLRTCSNEINVVINAFV